jgi:predicted nucleotidyltransferase/predicted RNase H-like HicB family nuclease
MTLAEESMLALTIVYETGQDGRVIASIPLVAGVTSQGRTREEARANVIDALRLKLSPERTDGDDQRDREQLRVTIACAPPTLEELRTRRDEILEAAARRGASNVSVFGSTARGDSDDRSDVDFLVDLEPGRSLLDLAGLLGDLRELLGCDVDVVTRKGLRDRIRDSVLAEAQPI